MPPPRRSGRFTYGRGRDAYDLRGRVAHEAIFNTNDGNFRCPNSQQGYSPFSTWTRGLAWAMCGMAEQLEFLESLGDGEISPMLFEAAEATCDFYIEQATAADGIPYWDTGAPNLHRLGDWRSRPSEPINAYEPVDSSAAAIAAQGLLRLGRYAKNERYRQAGLTVLDALFDEPYLSADANHQGLILHSIYHRPNGWDYVPKGCAIPAANRACGAITTPGKLRCTFCALRKPTLFDLLGESDMIIADLDKIEGRRYPARRRTQNVVGGVSPIQAKNFSIGNVTLDPKGGQVPLHNQEQEGSLFHYRG